MTLGGLALAVGIAGRRRDVEIEKSTATSASAPGSSGHPRWRQQIAPVVSTPSI